MNAAILGRAKGSAPWDGQDPAWLALVIAPLIETFDPARGGVYLSTHDAGAAISIGFRARALRDTVCLVSPVDFPLTLASSVSTFVARTLRLVGPNHTLVGDADASLAAWDEAAGDLRRGIIDYAVVIRFVAGGQDRASTATVVVLGAQVGAVVPKYSPNIDPIEAACRAEGLLTPNKEAAEAS